MRANGSYLLLGFEATRQRAKRPAKAISTPIMMGARSASAVVSIEEARTAQMAIRTMPVANTVAATKIARR
jgi:hypothetical protein